MLKLFEVDVAEGAAFKRQGGTHSFLGGYVQAAPWLCVCPCSSHLGTVQIDKQIETFKLGSASTNAV